MNAAGGAGQKNEMETDAIILAAGRGARLGELTREIPKCLLELDSGVTLLDALIDTLDAAGFVRNITVAAGYGSERVHEHMQRRYGTHISVIDITDFGRLNNAHTLREALAIRDPAAAILEVNGDVFCDPLVIAEAASELAACPSEEARIFVRPDVCAEEEMKVLLRPDGTVASLSKLHDPTRCLGEAFGITYFGPTFAAALVPSLDAAISRSTQSYFEDGINECIAGGNISRPHSIRERVAMEIDFPEDLSAARESFARMQSSCESRNPPPSIV